MSELTDRVRDKYPGVYDHISDADLEDKVLAKYPEYAQIASGGSRLRAAFSGGVKNAEAGAQARAEAPDTRPLPFDPAAFAPAGTGVQPTSPAAQNRDPTASEVAAGMATAALPIVAPAAPAIAGAAMSPAGQATIGGIEGFRRGGVRGGLIGAVTGGTLGKMLKVANLLQAAKAAAPVAEAATEAAPAAAQAAVPAGKAAFQEGTAKLAQMLGQEAPAAAQIPGQLPAQAQRLKQLFEVLGKEGLKRSGLTDAEVQQFLELLKQTKGIGGTRLP